MKNASLWKLVALFGGLVILFASVRIFRSPKLERNLPAVLVEIDSSRVTGLIITPAKTRVPVRLVERGGWKLEGNEHELRLEEGAAISALRRLMSLKPERLVSKRKDKWDEFGVGDSTGTRVQILVNNSVKTDLVIGRSGFSKTAGQQYGGTGYSYVRVIPENEVYAVEGFLDVQFNRSLNEWRDNSFLRLKRDSVDRIQFRYPADSSFVIENRMGKWMEGTHPVDSVAVVVFLTGMEFRNNSSFTDAKPTGSPEAMITFEKGARTIATIEAWPGNGIWTMRSSQQPEIFFEADATTRRDIFVGKSKFNPTSR